MSQIDRASPLSRCAAQFCLIVAMAAPGLCRADSRHSGTSVPITSHYAQMMGRKMGADYEFQCPAEISTGSVEAVELTIRTGLSASELKRLVEEEAQRFTGNTTPCLVAELDLIDTDGLVVKSMTQSHQKLLPYGQNQWTWQLKARKPGEYLLSLTISLCADNAHGTPIATPVAFNRKISVVGEPVAETGKMAGILIAGILLVLGGVLTKAFFHFRRQLRDKEIEIQPGGEDKIFVSYSKHDRKKVEPVITQLQEAGHRIWIDRHALEGASSWREEIVNALTNSQFMVFFASTKSYQSTNVGKELALAADGNLIIIPILIEDCEPSGASKFVVAGLQRIDARNRTAREVASDLSRILAQNGAPTKAPERSEASRGRESHPSAP